MRQSSPFLLILLGLLGITAILLILRQDDGTVFGLAGGSFAQLAGLVAIAAFLIFAVVGRSPLGRVVRQVIAWAAILAVILVGYTYRDELEWVARRVTSELFPGQAVMSTTSGGSNEVIVTRAGGHFNVVARVNNAPLEMMVDTGASVVTLTAEDAALAGIRSRNLNYIVPVSTANGVALAAPVIIDKLTIGSIELFRVSALVAQPGLLDRSLLGMNFLNGLGSFTISGNRMILTP